MNKLIAHNALRHYAAGNVPVWNPSLGAFYILSSVNGKPKFLIPTLTAWARLESRSKRKGTTTTRSNPRVIHALAMMGLSA